MFIVYRLAAALFIILIAWLIFRKKFFNYSKNMKAVVVTILIFVTCIGSTVMYESLWTKFDTPQEAFAYSNYQNDKVYALVEQDNVAIVAQGKGRGILITILTREQDGWNANDPFMSSPCNIVDFDYSTIRVMPIKKLGKTAVIVYGGGPIYINKVSDNQGNSFDYFKTGDMETSRYYYKIVDSSIDNYTLYLLNQEVPIQLSER